MNVIRLQIPEVIVIIPPRHGDARGFFSEAYTERAFKAAGIDGDFVQDNDSFSAMRGTVRGLHLQAPPFAQDKLVRVIQGHILDVAVDVRIGSPTFGTYVSRELSRENGEQLYIPKGFLHGFVTLERDTQVFYKVTQYYDAKSDMSVRWNDPALGIDWRIEDNEAVLSAKDAAGQSFADFASPFRYPA